MKALSKTTVKQPVRVAAVTVDPPGATFGPRTEQRYEFIWIMDGEAIVDFGSQRFRAEAGAVLLRRQIGRAHV